MSLFEQFAFLSMSDTSATKKTKELSLKSLVTGVVLGALLAPCNIYSGLKIGWSFNMSIIAALISYAFWQKMPVVRRSNFTLLETNITQTSASAAGSILSAGLVAPIPALTILTGYYFDYHNLVIWLFSVSLLGIAVAVLLRKRMIEKEGLSFPMGVASAETLKELYSEGRQAANKLYALGAAALAAVGLKAYSEFVSVISRWPLKGTAAFYGFGFDPSLLMAGFGLIIGTRSVFSLAAGAIFAWGIVAHILISHNIVTVKPGATLVYADAVEWLLWPGVALMVTASITSFMLSVIQSYKTKEGHKADHSNYNLLRVSFFIFAFSILAVLCQIHFFSIRWWVAILSVAVTFVLAVVAARVSGETGITPIGAMGKVTQSFFAVVSPANVTDNLMTANVTGGAAGQCADLMHDYKAGYLLKASYKKQTAAQVLGIVSGAFAGSAAYMILVPDPAAQLLTPEWPAPAVQVWKSVAELFAAGVETMPEHAAVAAVIAAVVGVVMALTDTFLSRRFTRFMPSAAAFGLAFVLPAYSSLSIFWGGLAAFVLFKTRKEQANKYLLPVGAGLIAGESIVGVIAAAVAMLAA